MIRKLSIVLFLTTTTTALVQAAPGAAAVASPAVVTAMEKFITDREISGSVTLVADENSILHLSAAGLADIGNKTPMATDSIFWIASMTKPITGTAVMMMQEEGKLSVNDPVSKYLPEFAALKDAAGNPVAITIKQCLTHTSGLAELSPDQTRGLTTLDEVVKQIPSKSLVFDPGSKWQYCQTGINTAARIVEVVSGKSFPDFLQQRLFDPLGMKDTSFYPESAVATRIAGSYKRNNVGELEKAELSFLGGNPASEKSHYPMANGGLFSTAEDYSKFARMILRGGELDGKRLLQTDSVKQMTGNQTGDLAAGFIPGSVWGLGWSIVRESQDVTESLSAGSFGHGGVFGTQAWIDPVKKRTYILMIQRANFSNQGGADGSEIRRAFQNAAAR